MIAVQQAHQLGSSARRRVTEVLVDGFAEDFAYFSKDSQQGQGVGTALLHHIKEQLSEPDSAATCHFTDVSEGNGHVTHTTL